MTWDDKAACKGLGNLFFPNSEENKYQTKEKNKIAKKICEKCTVREECWEYATHLEIGKGNHLYGVLAGYTPDERMAIYRKIRAKKRESVECESSF